MKSEDALVQPGAASGGEIEGLTTEDLAKRFGRTRDKILDVITKNLLNPVGLFDGRRYYNIKDVEAALRLEDYTAKKRRKE